MRVLVAGLGAMGLPMARALTAAGHETFGFDVRAVHAPDLVLVGHPRDARAEALVVVVRDAAEANALCLDDQALFARTPHPSLVLLCSTVSVPAVHALGARLPEGVALVDAPMSGAPVAAEERALSFMLGGAAADVDAAMPLVRAMGARHHRLGPLGAGMRAKVLNNAVAAASVVAVRRALAGAAEAGMDPEALLEVMRTSSGATWFGDAFARISWARETHAPGNTIGILVKDVAAGIESAGREPDGWDRALLAALETLPAAPSGLDAPDAREDAPPIVPGLVVAAEGLDRADLLALVRAHREDLAAHSPACSVHALAPDAFDDPAVALLAARIDGALVGCGAVRVHGGGLAELKTMRTVAGHARRGVGSALLGSLLGIARERGCTRVALETGTGPAFEPAIRFYERHGFARTGPFADYAEDPFSTFMARALERAPAPSAPGPSGRGTGRCLDVTPLVPVADLDASVAFYRDALGFEAVRVVPGAYAYLRRDGAALRLQRAGPGVDLSDRAMQLACYVDVDDVDALWEELRPALAALPEGRVRAPFDRGGGRREFHVVDEDAMLALFGGAG